MLLIISAAACKKTAVLPEEQPISPVNGSPAELTLDSIYLYALQTYLWNEALPSYAEFNPRKYLGMGSDIVSFKQELFDISQLKKNPVTGAAYEEPVFAGVPKYSFIQEGNTYGSVVAAITLGTNANDLGFEVASMGGAVYVSTVQPGAPADQAGLLRGYRLTEINGMQANPVLAEQAMKQSQVNIAYERQDGSKGTANILSGAYKSHGLLKSAVLTNEGRKIAYLSLAKFEQLAALKPELDQAFLKFSAAQVTDLVVDLRYNGGGYVESAEYLANLMAASSLNGKVMYAKHFNALLQQGKASILKHQPYFDGQGNPVYLNGKKATMADVDFTVAGNTTKFDKQGSLETLKNIYFIVSDRTASASEFLINSFKPYYSLKLVGSRTYGKPVGFFGINISRYTVYLSSFLLRNAVDEGAYYGGFLPDLVVADDVGHDFADPEEQCLKAVLSEIKGPSKTNIASQRLMSVAGNTNQISPGPVMDKGFPGMIGPALKLKKE